MSLESLPYYNMECGSVPRQVHMLFYLHCSLQLASSFLSHLVPFYTNDFSLPFLAFWSIHVWNCWNMSTQRACSENPAPSFAWKRSGWVMAEVDLTTAVGPWPRERSNATELCFVCLGKIGRGWGVPVHCTSLWCGRPGEAVLQGAAGARSAHRAAGGLPQGPAAPLWGGENLCHHTAVLCATRQKPNHPASLLWLPPQCV